VTLPLEGADFELMWPRELFVDEAQAMLLDSRKDWADRCELLLEDAFAGSTPGDLFRNAVSGYGGYGKGWDDPWSTAPTTPPQLTQRQVLQQLADQADRLKEAGMRAPYWLERRTGTAPGTLSLEAVARQFAQEIAGLTARGYFEKAFDKDCVDAPAEVDPASVLETHLGVAGLWPLDPVRLSIDRDVFFGVIEVLHDLVARPRGRSFHSWSGCGWHYNDFALKPGRRLYRWRVNRLLDRSDVGLQLASNGEDEGRLVAVTDDARTELAEKMAARQDEWTGDRVRHALALFRRRGASEHEKRSGVIALALVLEERRQLLKDRLDRKDEGALFQIANTFAIRHQRADQLSDYDPAFLDWIFWWYLATIELSDRLIARSSEVAI
jgi:hypothetical protein